MKEEGRRSIVARGWRSALALTLGLVLVLIVVAWVQRRQLAERFVNRELAARGVPGRYRIERIDPFAQRLADVSLGDPARPDLTAATVQIGLGWSPTGPYLASVTARGVRLRGRLVEGRVSLGAVDRLLPKPSGAPFAFPEIAADLADMVVALATPAGPVTIGVEGRGRLDDGFRGRLTLAAARLAAGGCVLAGMRGDLRVAVAERRPTLTGPVSGREVACDGGRAERPRAVVEVMLAPALDGWSGQAKVAAGAVAAAGARLAGVDGSVRFAGGPERTEGRARLAGRGLRVGALAAGQAGAELRFASGPGATAAGTVRVGDARYEIQPRIPVYSAFSETPIGPIVVELQRNFLRAAGDFDGSAVFRSSGAGIEVSRARLASRSGVRAAFAGRAATDAIEGEARAGGGGLPEMRARIAGDTAVVEAAPLIAGDARLALAPVRIERRGRATIVATRATLDGPVAGGRVEGLSAPVEVAIGDGGARLLRRCLPVGVARVAIAGFDFRNTSLSACPIPGGVRVDRLALAGRSGEAPASITTTGVRYANGRFAMGPVAVRLGEPAAQSRLDLASLSGEATTDGLAGRFAGATGKLGSVPILASGGEGAWRLAGGRLELDGRLDVADAEAAPRFEPLEARDGRLTLIDGRIEAAATLRNPASGAVVTRVGIDHALKTGAGAASLAVPGIAFDEMLQPEQLTRLTLGVVANVRGTIAGEGRIAWGPAGVTSTGAFATERLDLAAAFGPVSGIKGRIRFSDLLALATPPGQEASIAEVNPGVAVTDGVVRYQLLPGQIVRVEGGRWPFAGGELRLEPATIDLGREVERRLTFAVDGLDAARFVEQLGFANIAATGAFDGTLPMVFGQAGGRIEGGRLVARDGGGTLAYVGELTQAQLGVFGKLAFDALRSIRYRRLSIGLDGALDGEIVSRVSFAGVNQEPLEGVRVPFRRQLKGLPFVFNVTIRAPFRGLLGSARGFADPILFIRERLTPLAGVQPSASGTRP